MTVINWVKQHLTLFQVFKYVIYALLIRNIFLFYLEDSASAVILESDGVTALEFITTYAATIDTFNWVILLLLFELETWIIPDHKMTKSMQAGFTLIRGFCYAWIVYALYGYIGVYLDVIKDWVPLAQTVPDLCTRMGQAFMYSLERFETITAQNCTQLATSSELLIGKNVALTDRDHHDLSKMLAVADMTNAATWILVVLILEFEVFLQNRQLLTANRLHMIKFIKGVLYATLLGVAIFWWVYGEFLDFWDAFLWIVAFLFIENNIIEWNKESLIKAPNSSVKQL